MGSVQSKAGFTLTELVMVILLVSIMATVVTVNFYDFRDEAKIAVTQDEITQFRRAITGDSRVSSGGQYSFAGYEADMGKLPDGLVDLAKNPITADTTQDYDPITRKGWRGPYIDDSATADYANDAWAQTYVYEKANRRIRSIGPDGTDNSGAGDDIQMDF